jgi:hypothetical protein
MIKVLLLIFSPADTWEAIAKGRRNIGFVVMFFLLPVLAVSVGGEALGLLHYPRAQSYGEPEKVSHRIAAVYGAAQFVTSLLVVFLAANLVKAIAGTFHGRHTFTQSFKVVAYTLGPLFLLRLLDAFAVVNPWVSFAIGMVLSLSTLYYGIPRVLDPDPPNAFGLYLTSVVLLTMLSGLARFFTLLVLAGKIKLI